MPLLEVFDVLRKIMAKEISAFIKLQIPAGKAAPSPPVGPALGQYGLNIAQFVKEFNSKTENMDGVKPGTLLPVIISAYKDRSFDFIIKQPPTSSLILEALNLSKGSSSVKTDKVGNLSVEQMKTIASRKMPDLNASGLYEAMRIVAGSARSMGITTDEFTKEDV